MLARFSLEVMWYRYRPLSVTIAVCYVIIPVPADRRSEGYRARQKKVPFVRNGRRLAQFIVDIHILLSNSIEECFPLVNFVPHLVERV